MVNKISRSDQQPTQGWSQIQSLVFFSWIRSGSEVKSSLIIKSS